MGELDLFGGPIESLVTVVAIIASTYLLLKFYLAPYLIMDRGLPLGAALRESDRYTRGQRVDLLFFGVGAFLVMLLVILLTLGFGVLVAFGYWAIAGAVVYRCLVPPHEEDGKGT